MPNVILRILERLGYTILDEKGPLNNVVLNCVTFILVVLYTVFSWMAAVDGTPLSVKINILWMTQIILANTRLCINACESRSTPWLLLFYFFIVFFFFLLSWFLCYNGKITEDASYVILGCVAPTINLLDAVHTIFADLYSKCVD